MRRFSVHSLYPRLKQELNSLSLPVSLGSSCLDSVRCSPPLWQLIEFPPRDPPVPFNTHSSYLFVQHMDLFGFLSTSPPPTCQSLSASPHRWWDQRINKDGRVEEARKRQRQRRCYLYQMSSLITFVWIYIRFWHFDHILNIAVMAGLHLKCIAV